VNKWRGGEINHCGSKARGSTPQLITICWFLQYLKEEKALRTTNYIYFPFWYFVAISFFFCPAGKLYLFYQDNKKIKKNKLFGSSIIISELGLVYVYPRHFCHPNTFLWVPCYDGHIIHVTSLSRTSFFIFFRIFNFIFSCCNLSVHLYLTHNSNSYIILCLYHSNIYFFFFLLSLLFSLIYTPFAIHRNKKMKRKKCD
jgi:hypothetical protein